MGFGGYNFNLYEETRRRRAATNTPDFGYTADVNAGRTAAGVHDLLDPRKVAGSASPFAGKVMREVVISDEHPNPTPIAIGLDVTGSNIDAARAAHGKMPQLLGVLQRAGVPDPQINFCGIGDANSDVAPLQVGQFESDNRLVEQLEALYLEGNGGGQRQESYELFAYYMARHTHLEPLVKQGRKGYLFFIGDEMPYSVLRRTFSSGWGTRHTLESLTDDRLQEDIPTAQIFAELQEKYETFFLFQVQGAYQPEDILPTWREYLGERALSLDEPTAVCEVIAGILGMFEADRDMSGVVADLRATGADNKSIEAATKALATITPRSAAAKTTGSLPGLPDAGGATGTARL